MSSTIPQEVRETWEVPSYDTPLWSGRRHPWCVVIPVINEGDRIGSLLTRMAGQNVPDRADIVIVDGGSTDGSLDQESIRSKGVRGLLVKTGPGKLSAQLRCAYSFVLEQGYEGIVTIDGNDKDDPEAIPRFIDALEQGTDFIQASRFIEGGFAEGTPRSRDLAIRLVHAPVLRLASGFPWTDTTQGFRAYSRRLLLDPAVAPFRNEFVTYELLAYLSYRAPRLGYRCQELPTVRKYPPGDVPTKISGIRGNLVVLAILFKAALGLLNPPESPDAPATIGAPRRSATATLAISVASIVMGAALAALVVLLEPDQRYPDFIVGRMTMEGGTKLRDLLIGPAFLSGMLATFWLLSRVMARLEARVGPDHAGEFAGQLIWWSIPAVAAGGGLFLGTFIDMKLLVITAVGIGAVALACALTANRKDPLPPALVGMTLLAGVLIALLPTELGLVLSRLGAGGASEAANLARATIILIPVALAAACFALILLPLQVVRWLPGLLALGQIGLLAFFLILIPSGFTSGDGQIVHYPTTAWLPVLLAMAVAIGAIDVVRRLWRARNPGSAALLLSPLPFFALAAGIRAGTTIAPHVPDDDYHFGEVLLGWSSYGSKTIPYVDYMPAHGLVPNDLPGLVSSIFYDGTAATIAESGRISLIVLALAAFLALWLLTGSLGLAFVSTLFISSQLNWILLVPFICLWFSPALRREPSRWLCVWGLTAPLVILGVPAQGLVLVAASGVMAVRAAWNLWKHPAGWRWKEVAGSVLILASALILTPLMPMLVGAIGYVAENGPINQIAYGTPWGLGWQTGFPAGLVTESIRMSWLAIPVAGVSAIYIAAKRRMTGVALPALVVLLFGLLIIPYAMGRIDSGVSRPGLTAIFGWTALVPIVAWQVLKPIHRAPFLLLVAAMAAALNFSALTLNTFHLSAAPVLPTGLLRDGAAAGLPKLGLGMVEEGHWDRLIRLRNLISKNLKPDETYLDLTNRSAHYFYLDRQPPIPITAPYNLVLLDQQRRAVQALAADPPPLALLEAFNIVPDGVAHSLRVPLLYRFVVDNYTTGWEDGFIIGRLAGTGEGAAQQVQVPVKNLVGAEWDDELNQLEPAIPVDEVFPIDALTVGSRVLLGDGVDRRIIRIDAGSRAVFVDGAPPDADLLGSLSHFDVSADPGEETHRLRMALLDKAFAPTDLASLPVAWGRSNQTLAGRMEPVRHLTPRNAGVPVSTETAAGGVPEFSYGLAGQAVSGREADLLRFSMQCHGRTQEPLVVVTWSGQSAEGLPTGGQLKFTGDDGPLIVPLYAYPRWATLDRVTGVSIALDNPQACSSLGVDGALLSRAEMFRGLR